MKILIANRGEIALRVMRSARALGYGCVAVHGPGEAGAPHVLAADLAVAVSGYLDGPAIIAAALATRAGMVHPGYGFLSENAGFAAACAEAGLVFIGPSPEAIALMGDKGSAKAAAQAAGVPCLPGATEDLLEAGARIGVPLMVKAALGGGGKGMRLVRALAALPEALTRAASEAEKSFGDGALILEKALLAPRHIEVQVFGDSHGSVVHLGERDCSIQRRHQKVVEEAPSPAVDAALREQMGAAAVGLAKACGYQGAGTVEFLLEDGAFYFLEMNTRLQVEHPVTEAVTGLDLVDWQIRVARGEPLPLSQDQITLTGHAIEVRLYAEDPANGFLPQTGRILRWAPDEGLRSDDALAEGVEVGAGFDPMLAKLIAHGSDRETVRQRLIEGLSRTEVLGLRTNKPFLSRVLAHPVFAQGNATTAFLERDFATDPSLTPTPPDPALLALAVLLLAGAPAPRFGFTTGPRPTLTRRFDTGTGTASVTVTLDGPTAHLPDGPRVTLDSVTPTHARARLNGVARTLPYARDGDTLHLADLTLTDITLAPAQTRAQQGDGRILAPMAGTVLAVDVALGDRVTQGQTLAILEAMKMEHPLRAPFAGRITSLALTKGAQVRARQPLITLDPESP
ncbi:acetyl/propionyl/methylcrotonyl-CoA carboxylase subunit alpha [Pararhodobacter zhoushanensis]|uniref:ATP-grasp domain-containing protein n=1 Tax=Pararhodobacter zhoushanensis TaxID=2479545 RepID=A0ABT3H1W5_9RHOB|nr:biotin carboxylase N-terminal domain-containing protein [Pararhodobacter zhoushanensis]MCW1933815.1 ATP-grasp domain-containing protein [Pararhodobacter zhoushanensis]